MCKEVRGGIRPTEDLISQLKEAQEDFKQQSISRYPRINFAQMQQLDARIETIKHQLFNTPPGHISLAVKLQVVESAGCINLANEDEYQSAFDYAFDKVRYMIFDRQWELAMQTRKKEVQP